MNPARLLPAAAVLALNLSLAAKDFNVLDFGAAGDGVTPDTAAIQRAIEAAALTGGRVVVPAHRTFLAGTLQLKGGIDFHLAGELLISTNRADYSGDAVMTASNAPNLRLTGHGNIAGRSLAFMTGYDAPDEWWLFQEWRPKLFNLTGCTNLIVRDISFGDAPYWGLHLLGCENVLVQNVTVSNRLDVPNCDGIDPDHCRNVEIRDCHLTCGDDAIVIKATRQTNDFGECAHIRVHDCTVRTQDAGLKSGTDTVGDIHDVLFERCEILSASRGLCIQLRDEGNVYDVTFRDIRFDARYHSDPWWGHGEAISFTDFPRTAASRPGRLHDIRVENVTGTAENSIRVAGTAADHIGNILFKHVAVKFARTTRYAGGVFDNRPTKVLTPVEPHATPGFSVVCADDVTLEDCTVTWGDPVPSYFGRAVESANAPGLRLIKFNGTDAPAPPPAAHEH